MIGKDVNRARPTVVIFSIFEKFRREARRILNKEMAKHKFGVMTLSTTISRDNGFRVFMNRAGPLPPLVYGVPIIVSSKDGGSRCATIGGEIFLSEERYGMTVAHVFETQTESTDGSEEPSELKFDEYSDDEYSSSSDPESLLFHHGTRHSSSSEMANESFEAVKGGKVTESSSFPKSGTTVIGSLDEPPKLHQAHDWALIKLAVNEEKSTKTDGLEQIATNTFTRRIATPTKVAEVMHDDSLWAVTGRNSWLRGHGSSSFCAIKLKSQEFVNVWAGRFSDVIGMPADYPHIFMVFWII